MTEIDISDHIKLFKEHLEMKENLRIIVSGVFGSGKTFFLNKFFEGNTKYNVVKITPVNYSVANTEDIFELIKFDILFELLDNQNVSYDKTYFEKLLTAQVFLQKNGHQILKPIIEKTPKIGKSITKIANTLYKFGKEFDAFHNNVQIDKKSDAIKYLLDIKKSIPSIEEDSITELIRATLETIPDDKETVLLIDDLDRIDPEHIFRILNVFSSHFDKSTEGNKFFFDKVILVCDIENIRGIFHSKYGGSIDFSGYIDKFYSRNIFRFDNNKKIEQFIGKSLASVKYNDVTACAMGIQPASHQQNFLIHLLNDLLSRHYINLRKLINLKNCSFSRTDIADIPWLQKTISRQQFPIFVIIEFLIEILGSKKTLLEAIEGIKKFNTPLLYSSYDYAGLIVPLLDIERNDLNRDKEFIYSGSDNIAFKYKLKKHYTHDYYYAEIDPSPADLNDKNEYSFHQPDVVDIFLKLIKQLENFRMI